MRQFPFVGCLLLIATGCTAQNSPHENPFPTSSPALESTTTTVQALPALTLFEDSGFDWTVFEAGLLPGDDRARSLVDTAPFYEMDLHVDPALTGITGSQVVTFFNNEEGDLTEIVFRLFPNISDGRVLIEDLTVDGMPAEYQLSMEDSVMVIPLAVPLLPSESIRITMSVAITIPTEEGGKYGSFLLDEGILALAHFYPILAVYDDEGWNTEIPPDTGDSVYSDSGFYLVRISGPQDLDLVTSGYEVTRELSGSEAVVTFAAGPVRDFYVAASRRWVVTEALAGGVTVRMHSLPEHSAASERLLRDAVTSISLFSDTFGQYPFTEFDLVSTATLALGIEYPGVVVITETLFDPAGGLPEPFGSSTVAHEVAHQWFYSLVGNDQLDEPWLDEAMAQYATALFWRAVGGDNAEQVFVASLEDRWSRVDNADIPIGLPVAEYQGREYGAIIYGRGPLFLLGLESNLGPVFGEFLRSYVNDNMYGIVTSDGFQEQIEAICDCDLSSDFIEAVRRHPSK